MTLVSQVERCEPLKARKLFQGCARHLQRPVEFECAKVRQSSEVLEPCVSNVSIREVELFEVPETRQMLESSVGGCPDIAQIEELETCELAYSSQRGICHT